MQENKTIKPISLTIVLTPRGHLVLEPSEDAPQLDGQLASRLEAAFARGAGHGLLQLGAAEVQTPMPPEFAYWREFASHYVVAVRSAPPPVSPPLPQEFD